MKLKKLEKLNLKKNIPEVFDGSFPDFFLEFDDINKAQAYEMHHQNDKACLNTLACIRLHPTFAQRKAYAQYVFMLLSETEDFNLCDSVVG